MKTNPIIRLIFLCLLLATTPANANDLLAQWQQGLSGARLTAYSGSLLNNNSTLTVLDLCRNGRYSYYREGSWSVPGQAGGASNNRITGRWKLAMQNGQVLLQYATDQGQQGQFPVYLQNNGRVNIGGLDYAVQTGGAEC